MQLQQPGRTRLRSTQLMNKPSRVTFKQTCGVKGPT
jgi:hypothetical protein